MISNAEELERALGRLYKQKAAHCISQAVSASIPAVHPHREPEAGPQFNPETDLILLAYPGSLRGGRGDCLSELSDALDTELLNEFSAVHILPFYPSTSDSGFAVSNHKDVAPEWGDITALQTICKKRYVIADLVMHHVSSSSECLLKWLANPVRNKSIFLEVTSDLPELTNGRHDSPTTSFKTNNGHVELMTRYGWDQVDVDYRRPRAFLAMFDVVNWMLSQGISGVRLDALAYAYKPAGLPCIHSPETQQLSKIINYIVKAQKANALTIPEIDADVYGQLYISPDEGNAFSYSYGLAILIVEASLFGELEELSAYLSSKENGGFSINFLSTHDGLSTRVYSPVLSDERLERLGQCAEGMGFAYTRKNGKIYEINAPIHKMLSPNGDPSRLLCAYFILLNCPGTPMIYLNSLMDVDPWREGADMHGDARMLNRGWLEAINFADVIKSSTNTHFAKLVSIKKSRPELNSTSPISCEVVAAGVLKMVRSHQGKCLIAIVNLGHSPYAHELNGSKPLLRQAGGDYYIIDPLNYEWFSK